MLASVLSLQQRLELFVSNDINPREKREYKIERLVSYNNGATWVDHWIRSPGTFSSSVAASITGDSLDTFVVARGMDNKAWLSRLSELYDFHNAGFGPVLEGTFSSAPAVCSYGNSKSAWAASFGSGSTTSYDGVRVMLFARGMDDRIYWTFSDNGGSNWNMSWQPIGNGTFTSAPAAACSADGSIVVVFAKGQDNNAWWAFSTNKGATWNSWYAIGAGGKFTSMPVVACSADGKFICVFSKGKDARVWWAFSTDTGAHWNSWYPIGNGVFTSAPSVACSWDGQIIHVFARGKDDCIWQTRSNSRGAQWDIGWRQVNDKEFTNLSINI